MHKRHLIKLLGLTVLAAIGVMAVSVTAAQAKYLLLLNGAAVEELHLKIEGLEVKIKAKNGLTMKCTSAEGLAIIKKMEGGLKVTGEVSGTFKGCVWVGSEKTCTINDGGVGLIKFKSSGEIVMPDASTFILNFESAGFSLIKTEGAFCTIPPEEILSGSFHILIENALEDTKVKLGKILQLKVLLGKSELTELTGEVHISDFLNPEATIGFHLCNLGGQACS